MGHVIHFLFFESTTTRQVIFAWSGQAVLIWLLDRMLVRKKTRAFVILIVFCKILLLFPRELLFLSNPKLSSGQSLIQLICIELYRGFDLLSMVAVVWTYSQDIGKTMLFFPLAELPITIITTPVAMLVNWIEKRSDLLLLTDVFMPADLLIPVLIWLIWMLLKKPLLVLCKRYKNWKPRHPSLLWIAGFSYILANMFNGLSGTFNDTANQKYFVFHQIGGVILVLAVVLWSQYRNREAEKLNLWLNSQLRMTQEYYQALLTKKEAAEQARILVDKQMKELTSQFDADKTPDGGQVRAYLQELQQEYANLRTTIGYTDELAVDMVLSAETRILEEQGADVDIKIEGYRRGMVDPELFSRVLFLIIEKFREEYWADDASDASGNSPKTLFRLEVNAVRNALVVSADLEKPWTRNKLRLVKNVVSDLGGTVISDHSPFSASFIINPVSAASKAAG